MSSGGSMHCLRYHVLAITVLSCGACLRSPVVDAQKPRAETEDERAVATEGGVRELYHGSADAPIAGLLLEPKPPQEMPLTFFDDPTGSLPELERQTRLMRGERVTLSRRWDRAVVSQFEQGRTIFSLDGKRVTVPGQAGLALDSGGRTSVAWTVPNEESGEEGRLFIYGPGGELLHERVIERLEWLDVADHGERLALGARSETLVLDRRGETVARLQKAARGVLSRDGAWVALEETREHVRLFTLVHQGESVQPKAFEFEVLDKAVALAFDELHGTSTRLVRVTAGGLRTYRLDGVRPAIESELAPPAGFAWRSAAFADDGRLGAGRIQIVSRPQRHPVEPPAPPEPDTPGEAWLGVDVFRAAGSEPTSVIWKVTDWNHRAPEVAFDANHTPFALAWPSSFEVTQ